ncbi:uncharacterized protein METZ01_LOCUS50319 [marine metagenome]|uniref:Uncharacterized protein n=1 Tax=marine metagenome TaxID=408172 RepID=A0A381S034_9ZZZZ
MFIINHYHLFFVSKTNQKRLDKSVIWINNMSKGVFFAPGGGYIFIEYYWRV